MRHLIDPLDFSQQEITSLLDLADRRCASHAHKNARQRNNEADVDCAVHHVSLSGACVTSQPWPFPSSLMMAFKGVAVTTDVHVDGEETLQARWVTRDEYMSELVSGRMEAPGKATIARYMIEEWLGHDLP